MKYLLGIVVIVGLFLSGAVPYSLVYKENQLPALEGDNPPITASNERCKAHDEANLEPGDTATGSFSITLRNHTNRFVIVSVHGLVVEPSGGAGGMTYYTQFMPPNETTDFSFRLRTVVGSPGIYRCEITYKVGWGEF